jgi:hypothetical protein
MSNNILQSISNNNSVQPDISGIMIVGVVNKRFSNAKLIGSVINYSLHKGDIFIKIFLDANKKRLIVYSPNHPQGEQFLDLPRDGLFFPAIQNKSQIKENSLKVNYKFEIPVPKNKKLIEQLTYNSMENEDEEDEIDQSINSEMNQSLNSSPRETLTKETLSKGGPSAPK